MSGRMSKFQVRALESEYAGIFDGISTPDSAAY